MQFHESSPATLTNSAWVAASRYTESLFARIHKFFAQETVHPFPLRLRIAMKWQLRITAMRPRAMCVTSFAIHDARRLKAGLRIRERWTLSAALYNVFDIDDNDITYFYESQLSTESEPVEGIHFIQSNRGPSG
jgi:hypothetical protein